MRATFVRLALVVCALLDCRPRHEIPSPPPAPPPPRCAPFHVALIGEKGSWPAWFFDIRGRTVLRASYGVRLASTSSGLTPVEPTDPAFDAVERFRFLEGRWPDALWRIEYSVEAVGKPNHFASRWTGQAWEPFTQWIGSLRRVEPWGDGLLLDGVEVTGFAQDSGGAPDAYGLRILHAGGKQEAVPESIASDHFKPFDFAVAGRSIFVAASTGRGVVELRISVDKEPPLASTRFAIDTADVHLWAGSERDAVAFGGTASTDKSPLLVHWDGERWNRDQAPPGVDTLVAFDRTADGADRLFARRGERLSLWERPRGGPWHRVDLPEEFPDETMGMQALANGEAWIQVIRNDKPSLLLRLGPPTRVYHVGKGFEDPDPADACLPVEKDDAGRGGAK